MRFAPNGGRCLIALSHTQGRLGEEPQFYFFFLNDPAPPEISPLPHHAALPISAAQTGPPSTNPAPDTTTRPPLHRVSSQSPVRPPNNAPSAPPASPHTPKCRPTAATGRPRSEEHTSELQSQSNLVCRLLLEKKK